MGRHEASAQRDLFAATARDDMPMEVRRRLLPLLESLLREVTGPETGPETRGARNEQDHA